MSDLGSQRNFVAPKMLGNPLIIINMGAEMIYILQQRLFAQKISVEKSSRVLLDTVSALFDIDMIEKMFSPLNLYSSSHVRELFHQITHASIMRLNDQSMDKLYDLMLMGFKVQLIRSRDCYELIESTLNHIDNIHNIILNNTADNSNNSNRLYLLDVITNIRQRLIKTYFRTISISKLLIIRKYLFQWLQDRRIKVSILLQKHLQSLDGHIITITQGILPKYTQVPGIQYRINNKLQIKQSENNLLLFNSKYCKENLLKYTFNMNELHTDIGQNLYVNRYDNKKKVVNNNNNNKAPAAVSITNNTKKRIQQRTSMKNQLNDLAAIIVNNDNNNNVNNTNNKYIKLDLFDDMNDITTEIKDNQSDNNNNKNQIRFSSKFKSSRASIIDAVNNLDLGEVESNGTDIKSSENVIDDDEDDLMALIDDD